MVRLAALRLADARTLLAKRPDAPCAMLLEPADPLAEAQLRMLAAAAPWSPVMMEADVGEWNGRAFVADITSIEALPRPPAMPRPRRKPRLEKKNPRLMPH